MMHFHDWRDRDADELSDSVFTVWVSFRFDPADGAAALETRARDWFDNLFEDAEFNFGYTVGRAWEMRHILKRAHPPDVVRFNFFVPDPRDQQTIRGLMEERGMKWSDECGILAETWESLSSEDRNQFRESLAEYESSRNRLQDDFS